MFPTKKDASYRVKREKHNRCFTCNTQDYEFNTCNLNKEYYTERTDKHNDDPMNVKAMKAAIKAQLESTIFLKRSGVSGRSQGVDGH